MNVAQFSAVVLAGSAAAGFLGALTGLGGGMVIVPLLTLGLGVDIRYAIGASLVAVIATSSGAAASFLRQGFANIRAGMLLEVATTSGALVGASLTAVLPGSAIALIFGLVLLGSALSASKKSVVEDAEPGDQLCEKLRLSNTYPRDGHLIDYGVRHMPAGFALMAGAGALSGLLGIGSGAVKVLAMDRAMRFPFKVSTTTSNFMIGVTAAASAGVYLSRGYIDPGLAMPVTLGVLGGAMAGSKMLMRAPVSLLRNVFRAVLLLLAAQMIWNGAKGAF
jgi:uncharacterized membrane protein YfcA